MEQGCSLKENLNEIGKHLLQAVVESEMQKTLDEIEEMEARWKAFLNLLSSTKDKLIIAKQQWEDFRKSSDDINSWLKDMEVKCKLEVSKPLDLMEIGQRFEKGQLLQEEVVAYRQYINEFLEKIKILSEQNPDNVIQSSSEHLVTRYDALKKTVEVRAVT